MVIPGLDISPRAARTASDDELADALLRLALCLRDGGPERYLPLARAANLPLGEVVASPFAIRAVALAVASGASSVHYELRVPVPWPDRFATDDAVATDAHGYWDVGVLQAGKYRSFTQDEPFATYNPNHMSKWGPHELMHRVCGFFWRPGATRWETYVGARLNELLPVVLWYGFDELARLDRDGFSRVRDANDRPARLKDARWLVEPSPELEARVRRGLTNFREGFTHFDREMAAIDEELKLGRPVTAPHEFLNSSSDAIAYVVGHFGRLTDPVVGAMIGTVLQSGRDFVPSIPAYRARIENDLERLVREPIVLDQDLIRARHRGRLVWDLAHRCAHHERARLARLEPGFETAGEVMAECWSGDSSRWVEAIDALADSLPGAARHVALATGLQEHGDQAAAASAEQVLDGIASIAPVLASADVGVRLAEVVAVAPSIWARTAFADRVEAVLATLGIEGLDEVWAFERALAESTERDDFVERVANDYAETRPGGGVVHASTAFSLIEFRGDPVRTHAELDAGLAFTAYEGPSAWLIGAVGEGVSVLPAPAELRRAWQILQSEPLSVEELVSRLDRISKGDGLPDSGEAWVEELIAAGAVGWTSAPC